MLLVSPPDTGFEGERIMTARTCAACDGTLDGDAIEVRIGGNTVEVCCAACAQALNEADASAAGRKPGGEG
jgi:hypothetical protein